MLGPLLSILFYYMLDFIMLGQFKTSTGMPTATCIPKSIDIIINVFLEELVIATVISVFSFR